MNPTLKTQTENLAPYAFFGDNKGNFSGRSLDTGDFSIEVTAYNQKGGRGKVVERIDLDYSVVNSPEPVIMKPSESLIIEPSDPVTQLSEPAPLLSEPINKLVNLSLVDPETDKVVTGFEDLSTVSQIGLDDLDSSKYAFVAQINPNHPDADAVKSVKFESDLVDRTENLAPYALFGDNRGDFWGRSLNTGDFSVEVTVYAEKDGKGFVLDVLSIDSSIVETSALPEISLLEPSDYLVGQSDSGSSGLDLLGNDETALFTGGLHTRDVCYLT